MIPNGTSLFQINSDDLCDLERILPELQSALFQHLTPRLRTQIRRVKDILSNVRWNYGPPEEVEVV